jgi:uncharacterized protein
MAPPPPARGVRLALAAAAAAAAAATVHAQGADSPLPRSVSSSGSNTIRVPPDQAVVTFAVVSRGATASEALTSNTAASATALFSLRRVDGVEEEDIRLAALNVQPVQRYVKNATFEGYVDAGYEATRVVEVTLSDVALVPEVVAAVVTPQGANRLDGVSYQLTDATRTAVETQALQAATADARTRAAAMVAGLGGGAALGPPRSVSQGSVATPYFAAFRAAPMAMAAPSGGTPEAFAPGLIEVTATASAVFDMLVPTAPGGGRRMMVL